MILSMLTLNPKPQTVVVPVNLNLAADSALYPQLQRNLRRHLTGLGLAGNEGMEKNIETTKMGFIGTTIRIHSCIPSQPMARRLCEV